MNAMHPHRLTQTLRLIFFLIFCGLAALLTFRLSQAPVPTTSHLRGDRPFTSEVSQATISAIVLPHHDIVKQQRQEFLATVKAQIPQPKTIMLVSPNHYESGSADIQTTLEQWDTSIGPIEPNRAVIQALIDAGAGNESGSFSNEHGIRLILGDLERTWPDVTIVPIILKRSVDAEQVSKLADTLMDTCASCLLVDSVDFSHYQPAILANLHDRLTERLLQNRHQTGLLNLAEVDSPAALALMAAWADRHDTQQFVTSNHTNSGEITGNVDSETTTHLFGWYQTGEPTVPAPSVTFLVGGDMMFGRMIAHTFGQDKLTDALTDLGDRVFWGTDLSIINLEGPVSDGPVRDVTEPNNLIFNFAPKTVDALKYLGVNVASMANNHSENAAAKGVESTRRLLEGADITPLGGPHADDAVRVATIKGQDLTFIVIGVVGIAGNPMPDLSSLIAKYQADPSNRILIFPHWGNEYQPKHSARQQDLAYSWIDAGADLVIGAHPHVIQDTEAYKEVPIIYSLGNLLFDQTFSKETQQGLLVGGEFTGDELKLFALPTESRNLKPRLLRGRAKQDILEKLYEPLKDYQKPQQAGTLLTFPKSGVQ